MSLSIALRRSERLSDKMPYDYYFSKYCDILNKIPRIFKKVMSPNIVNFVSREKTVFALYSVIKIVNKNFPLLINYGNDDQSLLKMIKKIYTKSFDWLEEALNWFEEEQAEGRAIPKMDHTERLIKQIRKFRIYYEVFRDEYYKDIVTKYRIDRHIIYCIDSYL
jgi:hypothetical protein